MNRVIIFDETEGKSRKGFYAKQISEMYGITYVNSIEELKKSLSEEK